MPKRATVAYENAAEAKRKLRAVRPLRWHRMEAEGRYEAKGERGRYVLMSRSPNRRKGIFPWTVVAGSLRGPEIKPGGFDLKGDAQTFAAQYDAGLCGAPAVVVQAPSPQGLPPGVYRGTAAEAKRTPYFDAVERALREMDAGGLGSESSSYVASMEAAGVDPKIVASVLVATHQHRHDHNCVGKHVALAETAEHGHRRESHIFRGKRFDLFHAEGSWWYQVKDTGYGQGGYPSREAAMAGAQQALGMPAGFSMAVEGAEEAAGKLKKRWQGSRTIKTWQGDRGEYEIVDSPATNSYLVTLDKFVVRGFGKPVATVDDVEVWAKRWDKGLEKHPSFDDTFFAEGGAAEEAKKRLPQPDPGSGYWITHSSVTRNNFLMHGQQLVGQFDRREDALKAAQDLIEKGTSEAAEARRPKGRRRR